MSWCQSFYSDPKLPEYLRLGSTPLERQHAYRALFRAHVESELLGDIRAAANKGLALGGERFKYEIEQLCGRRMGAVKMGRPTKQAGSEKV